MFFLSEGQSDRATASGKYEHMLQIKLQWDGDKGGSTLRCVYLTYSNISDNCLLIGWLIWPQLLSNNCWRLIKWLKEAEDIYFITFMRTEHNISCLLGPFTRIHESRISLTPSINMSEWRFLWGRTIWSQQHPKWKHLQEETLWMCDFAVEIFR